MAAPVRDREALQRLNFLFQAAHWVLPHSPALARFYCSTQRGAARRLVLRMAPSVKRAVCRRCCSLLLPGAGGYLRLRGGSCRAKGLGAVLAGGVASPGSTSSPLSPSSSSSSEVDPSPGGPEPRMPGSSCSCSAASAAVSGCCSHKSGGGGGA
uniref:Ribonuclease P/MRP subunit p21 n=1 Tax=Aquila chrysaetos chrysaetos TaxID=223781 RepID=A0A663F6U4_AQUCH